ncbi:hypothetical protein AcV7_009972 [Taiwanofungus camphoratus]|nr:hypothetical protein AcV7_009972 [Antrodia cinnamomea]
MRSSSLKLNSLNMYLRCGWEKSSYRHLVSVLEHLRKQVLSGDGTCLQENRATTTYGYQCEPNLCPLKDCWVRGNYTVPLKPDLGWGTPKGNNLRRWEWYLGFIQVKKEKQEPIKHDRDVLISTAAFHEHKEVSGSTAKKSKMSTKSPQIARLGAFSASTKRKGPPPAGEDIEPPAKRFRSNVDTATAHIDAKLDPSIQPVLTGDEVQTAKYMNELLSHGVRSYATGLMIRNTTVTLWYCDRMGLVQSEAFDFKKEPRMLLLVIAAMESADHARMGICHFLKFPSAAYDSYDGVTLELDKGSTLNLAGEPLPKLAFQIDQKWPVSTDFGAIGRGTTIVPIKATGVAKNLFGEDDLVAKIAWPSASRAAEDNFVRVIRRKLKDSAPRWLDHAVDMKCSISRTMDEMRLPRAQMTNLLDYEERIFRILVMKKYDVLLKVPSVDEFKKIFIDVVNAHHWVWNTAGVLHRDISVNNIMFYRDEGNRPMGVLCDWDLAMFRPSEKEFKEDDEEHDEDEESDNSPQEPMPLDDVKMDEDTELQDKQPDSEAQKGSKECGEKDGSTPKQDDTAQEQSYKQPRYRTGTGPFMALDLLSDENAPLHRYRHDLESFFFVLAWICAVFDPIQHKFGRLPDWESPKLTSIGLFKKAFLRGEKQWKKTFSSAHTDYASLAETWVRPLRKQFLRIAKEFDEIVDLRDDRKMARRRGELQEVESINAEIMERKARRNELITYESFMECLGVPAASA